MSAADRKRRFKDRERRGRRCYTIEADEDGLARLLVANGKLSPLVADDHEAQRAGLEQLVEALTNE